MASSDEGSWQDLGDIVIGIDLGLTYTGVAFATRNQPRPMVIQIWPSQPCNNQWRGDNKVPTALKYIAGISKPRAWGYQCQEPGAPNSGEVVRHCFKLFLDKEFMEKTFRGKLQPPLFEHYDVRMWFTDFLRLLYDYITEHVCKFYKLDSWSSAIIHFVFSVPTIWESREAGRVAADEFKEIVKAAGFGFGGVGHTVEFELTEAEAAATYTARSPRHQRSVWVNDDDEEDKGDANSAGRLQRGNVLLVCDSGGGTTVSDLTVSCLRD